MSSQFSFQLQSVGQNDPPVLPLPPFPLSSSPPPIPDDLDLSSLHYYRFEPPTSSIPVLFYTIINSTPVYLCVFYLLESQEFVFLSSFTYLGSQNIYSHHSSFPIVDVNPICIRIGPPPLVDSPTYLDYLVKLRTMSSPWVSVGYYYQYL